MVQYATYTTVKLEPCSAPTLRVDVMWRRKKKQLFMHTNDYYSEQSIFKTRLEETFKMKKCFHLTNVRWTGEINGATILHSL